MMFKTINSVDTGNHIAGIIAARQKLLSTNIANVDTPGYTRKDLSFSQYMSTLSNPLETKLSQTLGPSPIFTDQSNEKVDIGKELSEMQKTYVMYSIATRQVNSMVTQLKTAINMGS